MSELADFGGGIDRAEAESSTDESSREPFETPVCCVDGCETDVPGLFDGRDAHDREGIACTDCWDYHDRHNHWPDEESENCAECLVDDGAVKHECDDVAFDAVILNPGSECDYCGEEIENTEEPDHE